MSCGRSGPTIRSRPCSTRRRSTWRRGRSRNRSPENSILLGRDVAAAIAELKESVDQDIVILGSGDLVRSLMPTGLIDRYVLSIHPLVLGTGQRLFVDGGPPADLELEGCRTTATGVMIATFAPAARG
jgi:dihydrofolate reductase